MPGFLSLYADTEVIPLGGEYTVEIRQFLNRQDYAAAQRTLILPRFEFKPGTKGVGGARSNDQQHLEATLETEAYQAVLVARAVVRWNLTDEEGVLLPLDGGGPQSLASVNRLPQIAFNRIYERVRDLNNPGGDLKLNDVASEAAFPGEAGSGSEDGVSGTADPESVPD
jgi:hypothetical protein